MSYPRVAFDIIVPMNGDELAANIAHARSLGLPMADAEDLQTLIIVANGPSRNLFDVHQTGEYGKLDTLAVNGALAHFTDAGTAPTFWAACDPQALVAEFLPENPPLETIYLVASKCHPSVFQKLQGRDVRLWDINDHPMTRDAPRAIHVACSVTLVVLDLMRDAFGYRAFETYGWDGCFNGTEHHAGEHFTERPENFVIIDVGAKPIPPPAIPQWLLERHRFPDYRQTYDLSEAKRFETTSTWAAEAQDATVLSHYATYSLKVHGDGLVRAILESR